MDGWVIIGTKLDSKQLEKDLKSAERRLQQYEGEAERLTKSKAKAELDLSGYEEAKRHIQELTDEANQYTQSENEITKNLEIEKNQLQEIEQKYSKQIASLDAINQKIIENEKNQGLIKNQIDETNKKLQNTKVYENIKKITDGIGKSITNVIKKVGRWALALVGVRSAYSAIRGAISLVQSKNEGIASQFDVMKTALANSLTPLVEKIVGLIAKLMMYINYIAFRLTGKYIFDFSKAFSDANKSSKETLKNVTKMTAGFDEMNVVSSGSSGGGGGGGATADMKNPFADWGNFEPPKWLETITNALAWIKDNWEIIVGALVAIGAGFLLFKLFSPKDTEGLTSMQVGLNSLMESAGKSLETIAILGGLALVIKSVTDMITAFSESGMKVSEVLGLMGTIVGSVIALITALTIATQFIQTPMAMGGLAVLTASISAIMLVIAATLPTILDAVGDFTTKVGPVLIKVLDVIGKNISSIIYALGTSMPPIVKSIGSLFTSIFNGISKVVTSVGNVIVNIMKNADKLVNSVLKAILTFIKELGPAINVFVNNAITATTKLINFMISAIEYLVNTLIVGGVNKIISAVNSVAEYVGITIPRVPNLKIERFVPKLAVGGIVNMPGKGVPIGGAIAGEVSKEGVIPLTDSQAMQELGSTIGKYITINANITNSMNGRIISRELKRINANDNFAYNK